MKSNKAVLTPSDWATVCTAYSRGEKTVRDLADQFKVSPQAIHKGLNSRGVTKGSNIAAVQQETEDAASAAHRAKVMGAHATADQYTKYTNLFVQLMVKRITEGHAGDGIHTANADVLTLKNALIAVRIGRKENWEISKIEELLAQDEDLAVLNVGEYTEDELELIRAANEEAYAASKDDVDLLDLDYEDDVRSGGDDEEDGDGEA